MHITSILSNKVCSSAVIALGRSIFLDVCLWMTVPQFLHSESGDGTTCLSRGCQFNLRILGLLSLVGCSSKITASIPCEKFLRCKLC